MARCDPARHRRQHNGRRDQRHKEPGAHSEAAQRYARKHDESDGKGEQRRQRRQPADEHGDEHEAEQGEQFDARIDALQ
jgi:hypothetical protein